jgi:signal transduction histidine kinase
LTKRSNLWLAAIAAVVAAQIVAALVLKHSFALTAFSDVLQSLLLLSGTAVFVLLAIRAQGRMRLFWSLIVLGNALWFANQFLWTYDEAVLHIEVPNLWYWDVILFLHIVPMMAALALRPHKPKHEYARVGELDFLLLLFWWLYLYVLVVMPWQYVVPNVAIYNHNLDTLYSTEKLVMLAGLVGCILTSKGEWRKLYSALLGMTVCYSISSTLADLAIHRNAYYSGSLYDIPLVIAMASLTWIGLRARVEQPETSVRETPTVYGIWVARFSMIAVFSLPVFAVWALSETIVPQSVRIFRLILTMIAAFFMAVLVFVRQRLLDRELIRLLNQSRDSFANLKRLQAQILQSEKIASIGQLVAGVAHEINNPLTAMLGYSDLLLNTPLTPVQRPLAAKIGHYVRRTKSLVASLISFARQGPSTKTSVDLNALARTAVKLTQPQWEAWQIEVRIELDASLLKVFGDSNQLLQVCLELIGNGLYAMSEGGSQSVTVRTRRQAEGCLLEIAAAAALNPSSAKDDASSPISGLGLSACQAVLENHQGRIYQEYRADGSLLLQMHLPAADHAASKNMGTESTLPVLVQSQPYA